VLNVDLKNKSMRKSLFIKL